MSARLQWKKPARGGLFSFSLYTFSMTLLSGFRARFPQKFWRRNHLESRIVTFVRVRWGLTKFPQRQEKVHIRRIVTPAGPFCRAFRGIFAGFSGSGRIPVAEAERAYALGRPPDPNADRTAFSASPRSLCRPALPHPGWESPRQAHPHRVRCVEPGFGSQRTITGKRGTHAIGSGVFRRTGYRESFSSGHRGDAHGTGAAR